MKINRAQLQKFLPDNESIRLFEMVANSADNALSSSGVPVNASGEATSTTLVTCASSNVQAGGVYRFEFDGLYSATTGTRWVVDGPAATIGYTIEWSLSPTASSFVNAAAYNQPAAANASSASTTANVVKIRGVVSPTANGLLSIRFASGGAAVTRLITGQLRLIRLT